MIKIKRNNNNNTIKHMRKCFDTVHRVRPSASFSSSSIFGCGEFNKSPLRIAVVCRHNINRSVEIHRLLKYLLFVSCVQYL